MATALAIRIFMFKDADIQGLLSPQFRVQIGLSPPPQTKLRNFLFFGK